MPQVFLIHESEIVVGMGGGRNWKNHWVVGLLCLILVSEKDRSVLGQLTVYQEFH